jgi:RluA family pseudouridine synthase
LPLGPGAILYDDHQVVAINKPPGLLSHANQDPGVPHVVTALARLLAKLHTPRRFLGIVHRLDKETSGVMLVATTRERARFLSREFSSQRTKKLYLALCFGKPLTDCFAVDAPLTPIDPQTGRVSVSRSKGRSATTEFRVLSYHDSLGLTLLQCMPRTGRSHQIRAHLQLSQLPIVGDKRYQTNSSLEQSRALSADYQALICEHQLLHARSLTFIPTSVSGFVPLTITAPLPPAFSQLIDKAFSLSPELAGLKL